MVGKISATVVLASICAFSGGAFGQTAPQQARVLVFPLRPIHLTQDTDWVPKSVNENVVDALDRSEQYVAIPYGGELVVQDNNQAARNARQSNFPLAVRGTIQVVDTQVRLTAQLVDAHDGSAVRTAMATGAMSDLLKVEDDLAAQLLGEKSATTGNASTASAPATNPAQPPIQIVIQNTPPAPEVPNYNYAGYPYSAYPYPGYPVDYFGGIGYPGVIITTPGNGGGHHHGHDHDHGHDGHGGDGHGGGPIYFTPGTPEVGRNTPGGPAFEPGVIGEPANPLPRSSPAPVTPVTTPGPVASPFHALSVGQPGVTAGGSRDGNGHR
ncbi:MAG TPA: hypothetical protein VHQ47_16240 [Phycisphaerae bacterium]|nr:hypothetical protein [Phycisphaerae bacterium]